jgi:hypothetical protein
MGMGIVSDSDFDKEFDKLNPHLTERPRERTNETPATVIKEVEKGRGEGNVEVPNSLRNIIGQTAITGGRQEAVELAQRFGISPSSASAYANGSTSTASYDKRPNGGVINSTKDRIAKRARNRLMLAMKHMSEDKLEAASLKDLSAVAKDMSIVSKNMDTTESNVPDVSKSGPTFVFYSPQFSNEERFDIVRTKE